MSDHRLTLMAVHAHPDDEAIATGGILARAAAEGKRVVLVCCTRGEVGEIRDPAVDPETTPEQLGAIRSEEVRRAAEILGVTDLEFLGYRDSGMAGTPENEDPRAFANADPDEAAGRLVAIIRRTRPDVVVTYDERGGYGHPDHIATHRTTMAAVAAADDVTRFPDAGEPWEVSKVYEASWSREEMRRFQAMLREAGEEEPPFGDEFIDIFGVPEEEITTRVDVRAFVRQKREAIEAHRTQIPPDDSFLTAPEELFTAMMGLETFVRRSSTVPALDREDDLFAGL
jgi:mycothiol conjugate amidase Mca